MGTIPTVWVRAAEAGRGRECNGAHARYTSPRVRAFGPWSLSIVTALIRLVLATPSSFVLYIVRPFLVPQPPSGAMQLALPYAPGLRSYPPRAPLVSLRLTNTSTRWPFSHSLAACARLARPACPPAVTGRRGRSLLRVWSSLCTTSRAHSRSHMCSCRAGRSSGSVRICKCTRYGCGDAVLTITLGCSFHKSHSLHSRQTGTFPATLPLPPVLPPRACPAWRITRCSICSCCWPRSRSFHRSGVLTGRRWCRGHTARRRRSCARQASGRCISGSTMREGTASGRCAI